MAWVLSKNFRPMSPGVVNNGRFWVMTTTASGKAMPQSWHCFVRMNCPTTSPLGVVASRNSKIVAFAMPLMLAVNT